MQDIYQETPKEKRRRLHRELVRLAVKYPVGFGGRHEAVEALKNIIQAIR